MAQPWALTTKVSQTSENWAPGSRLVTSIGTVTGTRELRRNVGTCVLCIASALSPVVSVARPVTQAPHTTTLALSSSKSANSVVPFQDVRRPLPFVTNERQSARIRRCLACNAGRRPRPPPLILLLNLKAEGNVDSATALQQQNSANEGEDPYHRAGRHPRQKKRAVVRPVSKGMSQYMGEVQRQQ